MEASINLASTSRAGLKNSSYSTEFKLKAVQIAEDCNSNRKVAALHKKAYIIILISFSIRCLHLCTVFCSYLLTKRWVWAYPKDQFDEAINTSNDIERQTRSSSMTSLLTNAIQAFQGCSQCRVTLLDHWGIEAV